MKWSSLFSAVLAMLGMVASAEAGSILQIGHCCGAEKSCGCGPSNNTPCCRPVICRPTCPNVCTYQRACCKPQGCCDTNGGCGPKACGPAGCGPAATPACTAPAACGPAATACAPACTAPTACAPACGPKGCGDSCGAPKNCCNADPCEIAHWIYVSQTACYAKDRRRAIDKIGDCYSCVCNPEIMCALIYALNDADERVRHEAAEEIHDQLKKNPCCCNEKVTCALTAALADCDRGVARAAERALECCGYDVKNCCEEKPACGAPSCGKNGACGACGTGAAAPAGQMAPAPAPAPAAAPTSVPTSVPATTEPEAYFPSRLKTSQSESKKSLSNLFGLRK